MEALVKAKEILEANEHTNNSLYARVLFSLGLSAVRDEEYEKAEQLGE